MRTYGQYCPIARASEILAERWTPIILRNLLYGCVTFTELAEGAPGISRTLLSQRLRELGRAGVITIQPKADGQGSRYELTPMGRELWTILQAMGDWGARWLELAPATASPDVVLWSWCYAYLERDRLPDRRVLVRFEFPGQPKPRHRLWLLVEDGNAEICHRHPGFDEDLHVVVHDPRAFAEWHLGLAEWSDALRAGAVEVTGARELARALPTWNRRRTRPEDRGPALPGQRHAPVPPSGTSSVIAGFGGRVVSPQDDDYDRVRAVWNGAIDRRPALVAQCTGASDVVAALRFARECDLPVAVRGGGHGVAGLAVCDDGLVIDLAPLRSVQVDAGRHTAKVGAGVLWGELDAATQAFGLATTGGIVSHTGVGGLTLGGGIGWLMRRHGLAADNLLAAQVVTADGDVVHASAEDHPDLLWGLRGGGGNFGIVTEFTFRLHRVGPKVLAGPVLWPMDDAREVLRTYAEFVAVAPREVATVVTLRRAPPLPPIPPELHGRPVCQVTACHVGDPRAGERALEPMRRVGNPLLDLIDLRPYTQLQSIADEAVPHGWHYYWKSANLAALDNEVVDVLAEHGGRAPSPWSYAILFHLGGAVDDVDARATAYTGRGAVHALNINAVWRSPGAEAGEGDRRWTREFAAAVRPHQVGAYVNFLDGDDRDQLEAAYGAATHRRLTALKDRYDPENIFRANHNILPSKGVAGRHA